MIMYASSKTVMLEANHGCNNRAYAHKYLRTIGVEHIILLSALDILMRSKVFFRGLQSLIS